MPRYTLEKHYACDASVLVIGVSLVAIAVIVTLVFLPL